MTITDISKYRDYEDIKGLFNSLLYLSTEAIRKNMMDVNEDILKALQGIIKHIDKLGFDTKDFENIIRLIHEAQNMTAEQLENVISIMELDDEPPPN